MEKEKQLLVICGLVIFVVGGVMGFLIQKEYYQPQIEKTNAIIEVLSSKMVSPVTASGLVKSISPGRSLVLTYGGNIITVKVSEIAKVFSSVEGETTRDVGFQGIKVGDFVNMSLSTYKDYVIEANQVLIVSSAVNKP